MQVIRLSCTTLTNRWWLVAAIATIVMGAIHSNAVAAVGDGPEPATNQQRGLDVAIVVGIPAQAGDITATAMRRIGADVFAALEPGDKITLAAARGSGRPIEILSIIRRAEDVGAAGAATVARAWREKADPLAGRSADVAAGMAALLAGRGDASIDLLVVVPAARVGSAGASSIWASAKRARDDGAVVWLIGPPDSDLQDAAKTGVLNWTSVDAATPAACAAWVAQARRNQGGGPSVTELQGEIDKVRGELAALRAQGEKDRAAVAGEIAARDARIKALEREAEEAIAGRRSAEAREAATLVQLKERDRGVAEARSEANAGAEKIQALTRELELANARRVTIEQALDDLRAEYEAKQASWDRQSLESTTEMKGLRSANATLQAENDCLRLATHDADRTEGPATAPEAVQGDGEHAALADQTAAPQPGNATAEGTKGSVQTSGRFLLPAGVIVLGIVGIGGWHLARGRRRVLRVKGTWETCSGTTQPFDVTFDPACQVLTLPRGGEPSPCGLDHVEDQPHFGTRGRNLEVRVVRADCDVMRNGEPIADTHAPVAIGDEVTVRYADGESAHVVVRLVQRLVPQRHLTPTTEAAASAVAGV